MTLTKEIKEKIKKHFKSGEWSVKRQSGCFTEAYFVSSKNPNHTKDDFKKVRQILKEVKTEYIFIG